jgi:hypothetical protein
MIDRLRLAGLSVAQWQSVFSVFVVQADASASAMSQSAAIPPVLGQYEILSDRVRFTAHFPLVPGLSYRATADLRGLVASSTVSNHLTLAFSLPSEARTPSTLVDQVFPSGDALPENILRFYVRFSAPMQRGQARDQNVLLGPDGRPLDGDIAIEGHETQWRFTPSYAWQAGSYHLEISASLEDVSGNTVWAPLDLDVGGQTVLPSKARQVSLFVLIKGCSAARSHEREALQLFMLVAMGHRRVTFSSGGFPPAFGSFGSIWRRVSHFRSTPDCRHVSQRWISSIWAIAQNRTHAPQQRAASSDRLVGAVDGLCQHASNASIYRWRLPPVDTQVRTIDIVG